MLNNFIEIFGTKMTYDKLIQLFVEVCDLRKRESQVHQTKQMLFKGIARKSVFNIVSEYLITILQHNVPNLQI